MKKIVLFISSLSSGGAEHQMAYLASFLSELDYVVSLVTYDSLSDHFTLPTNVQRIRLQSKSKLIRSIKIFRYIYFLKADCLISFTQKTSLLCLIPMSFRFKRIRFIAGERNYTEGKQTSVERKLFKFFYRFTDYIVPNSFSQADYIKREAPHFAHKVVPIINYTDLSLFQPKRLPHDNVIRIGVFARFEAQKNCVRFIEALNLIRSRNNQPFIVEWYGNHTFSNEVQMKYFEKVRELIKALDLEDLFFIKEPVIDVSSTLSSFDAICLPSLFEGFSNSISEGIASGKLMLVSDVSDNKLMVREGFNGFLFNPFDVNSIANAFERFFSLPNDERIKMGNNSRTIAESLFNRNHFINSYVNLIEANN